MKNAAKPSTCRQVLSEWLQDTETPSLYGFSAMLIQVNPIELEEENH